MTSAQLCSESLAVSDLEFSQLRERALALGTVIEHDDCSISAFGRAEAIPLPNGLGDPARLAAVTVRLAEIARRAPGGGRSSDRDPSGLPLALGALPFRPDRPGTLVVPEVVAISSKGAPRVVMVTARGEGRTTLDRLLGARPAAQSAPPDSFRLESARPHEEYLERVALAVDEVRSGRLEKVVLAREVLIEANRAWRQGDLLEHLRSLHPSCTTFFVDGFLGATPELLVRRSGELFSSHPLAGTAARSGDPECDRRTDQLLLDSRKEQMEHRAVVEAIAKSFAPVAESVLVPHTPSIVELRNVSHLGTRIEGRLRPASRGPLPSVLELLSLIHPTPAVCGSPPDLALEYLDKSEDFDRDRYGGAVGWVRADGDGEFHLGIRSAIVEGSHARLFAGAGIVGDSDPATELAETQLKLQAVLAAAVRP